MKKSGADLIAEERKRHEAVEGWASSHDDEHIFGEMAKAAACYAIPNDERRGLIHFRNIWPIEWDPKYWKPSPDDRVKELIKAGALIAAEIDRLLRLEEAGPYDDGMDKNND